MRDASTNGKGLHNFGASGSNGGGGGGGSGRAGRRKSTIDKHYSTWNDRYSTVDRFFLYFTPLLFAIFNFFYWGYFYVWGLLVNHNDNNEDPIHMPTSY